MSINFITSKMVRTLDTKKTLAKQMQPTANDTIFVILTAFFSCNSGRKGRIKSSSTTMAIELRPLDRALT